MTPGSHIKLVSELLDLPLFDASETSCGIVDDVEFEGGPGKPLRLKALLVGPGAYRDRLPRWAMWIVKMLAGDGLTRVPMDKVRTITSAVRLNCRASDLGLGQSEAAARKWVPRGGAY
jgi:hypothetical protein